MTREERVERCAVCGALKPITHFDPRFIGKPVRLTCAVCRGVPPNEADRWQEWRREQQAAGLAAYMQRLKLEQEEHEAREREQKAKVRRRLAWRRHMRSQGYSREDITMVEAIMDHLARAGTLTTWTDITAQFRALQPPYIGAQQRSSIRKSTRELVYSRQGGRCAYCACDLQPLNVWKWKAVMQVERAEWEGDPDRRRSDGLVISGLPVLDHRTPVSRGGSDALDNFSYACFSCNQRKGVRTAEEFAAMPHDALSELERCGLDVMLIAQCLWMEAEGFTGFAEGLEWQGWLT